MTNSYDLISSAKIHSLLNHVLIRVTTSWNNINQHRLLWTWPHVYVFNVGFVPGMRSPAALKLGQPNNAHPHVNRCDSFVLSPTQCELVHLFHSCFTRVKTRFGVITTVGFLLGVKPLPAFEGEHCMNTACVRSRWSQWCGLLHRFCHTVMKPVSFNDTISQNNAACYCVGFIYSLGWILAENQIHQHSTEKVT